MDDPECPPDRMFADPRLAPQLNKFVPGYSEICDDRYGCGLLYGIRDFDGLQCRPDITEIRCVACPIDDLRPLRHVKSLDIAGANLRDLDAIAEFDELRSLSIRESGLVNVDALFAGDANVASIEGIDLSGNRIATIAGDPDLPQLVSLNLSDNELTELPPAIASVRWLDLAGNQIADVSALSGQAMHYLDLSRNDLLSLGDLFLPEAERLVVDDNPLGDVRGLVAPQLVELLARGGALAEVPPASALPSWWLDLADNQISDLAPLADLGSVSHLDLSGNPIDLTSLPAGLVVDTLMLDAAGLTSLAGIEGARWRWLSVADNAISDLTPLAAIAAIDPADGACSSIELAGNPITTLAPLDGVACSHLGLARTGFKALDELLGPASGIDSLDLRSNEITDASGLASGPFHARALDLSDNLLVAAPDLTQTALDLESLDLSDNPLATIGPLPADLEDFACRRCGLTTLDSPVILSSDLQTLDLTANPLLSVAAIAGLRKLDVLTLDEIGGLDLSPLALRDEPLFALYMRRAGLTDTAEVVPLASHLYLEDNALSELPPSSPPQRWDVGIPSIALSGNPIELDVLELVAACARRVDVSLSPFSCISWELSS